MRNPSYQKIEASPMKRQRVWVNQARKTKTRGKLGAHRLKVAPDGNTLSDELSSIKLDRRTSCALLDSCTESSGKVCEWGGLDLSVQRRQKEDGNVDFLYRRGERVTCGNRVSENIIFVISLVRIFYYIGRLTRAASVKIH